MSKGIYKITNKINNKNYIGKSKNIEQRWQYHIQRKEMSKEYDKALYRAFRKYGVENFTFEIIEIIQNYEDTDLVNQREKYWIQYYNSFGSTGYNETLGGDGGQTVLNPRQVYGKLSEEEVLYLRKRYLESKYPSSLIYEKEFKDKISKRGFQAIWLGENSKNIMPEVFSQENKDKQIKLSRAYEGVLRRKVSLQEKQQIKQRILNGEKENDIWKKEYQDIYSRGGFRDMLKAKSLDEEINFYADFTPL